MNGERVTASASMEASTWQFRYSLAIAISYTNNHSVLWAIIHGIFSWLYVLYLALSGPLVERS